MQKVYFTNLFHRFHGLKGRKWEELRAYKTEIEDNFIKAWKRYIKKNTTGGNSKV